MNEFIIQKDMEDIFSRNIDWTKLGGKSILITGAYDMLASYIVYYIDYLNIVKKMEVSLIAVVRSPEKLKAKCPSINEKGYIQIIKNDLSERIEIDVDIDYIIHAAS